MVAQDLMGGTDYKMKTMEDTQQETGWEFTLPRWAVRPYSWTLAILIIVAIVLSIVLFNKLQAAKLNQTGIQSLPQTTNQK